MSAHSWINSDSLLCLSITKFVTISYGVVHLYSWPHIHKLMLAPTLSCLAPQNAPFQVLCSGSPAELPSSSHVRFRKSILRTGSLPSARPYDWTELTHGLSKRRGDIWASWICSFRETLCVGIFNTGQRSALSLHSAEEDLWQQRLTCSPLIYTNSKQVRKNYEITFLYKCIKWSLLFFKEKNTQAWWCIP